MEKDVDVRRVGKMRRRRRKYVRREEIL